ncbi:unnamed protein product [Adineta ricciae]|uniref:Uncharacterized protein n=1 Tax=Adineta ricciae TaxID=249248 RepID=A0A814KK56_ADIRI|nr:unnamed protein product [Adineta ricciae]
MLLLITVFLHFIQYASTLSECQSRASIWTYYPCSFIISSTSSTSSCTQASVSLAIDECLNQDLTFFWHFPFGNMTITLKSENNQAFFLRLSKIPLPKRKLIKNIYYVNTYKINSERQILNNDQTEDIIIPSNRYHQSSIKFETVNEIIFDYGTFIQMTVWMNDDAN